MKFEVEKIFQEMRRTARGYSQQASGGRKVHCFSLSSSPGVGVATHLCNLCYDVVNSFLASPILFHHLLLVSSVKHKLEGAEVGVERVREEEEEWVELCTVIAATVRWLIHPPTWIQGTE